MTSRFNLHPILLAAGIAAALASASASAAIVQAGVGSYNLGTDSAVGATASPQTACGTGGQDALIFTGAGANNIGIHSYSCGLGLYEFGSRSSGENTYYVDGSGSTIGSLSTIGGLSVFVSPGQVGAFGSTSFAAGEYQYAEMDIDLVIDGIVYIDDRWTVEVGTAGAITTTQTSNGLFSVGFTFDSGAGYASFGIQGTPLFFNLANGDHDISYVISSMARGNITSTTSCRAVIRDGGFGEVGEGVAAFIGEEGEDDGSFASYCGAGAQSGDPFNAAIARALPEPGSLALLGLAGLAFASRRRRG